MLISDIIEEFIKQMVDGGDGSAELQRNELASQFNCVPSQINYVLSTRFTNERGYIIESRRGGGGCIRIKKISVDKSNVIMHIINSVGCLIDYLSASVYIKNLLEYNIISSREAKIMLAALNDKVIIGDKTTKDSMRAMILKAMLINLL